MTSGTDVVEASPAFPDLEWRNFLQSALEIPLLVRFLRLPPGGRILEVGCGRGIGLLALAGLLEPSQIAGIDIDAALLAKAESAFQDRGVRARFLPADVRDLPFEDTSFDTVFDFGTCYHAPQPERALLEIARVLRPGGLFVHETKAAQLLAHPTRASRRALPWHAVPGLVPHRKSLLWAAKHRTSAVW
jgi:ubiquinone/menaquinone biosynthesis C-methylase UbiE